MMLVSIKGDNWKTSRNLVSPMFTSSKLKALMPLIHHCGKNFTKYLGNFEQDHLDCKEAMQRFTIEILGSLGCGVTPNVLNETNEFYDQVSKYFYV
jgi:cytochrome P450 family 9